MTKGNIAYNDQFRFLSQCFQRYSKIILASVDDFDIVAYVFSKSSAADILYVGQINHTHTRVDHIELLL